MRVPRWTGGTVGGTLRVGAASCPQDPGTAQIGSHVTRSAIGASGVTGAVAAAPGAVHGAPQSRPQPHRGLRDPRHPVPDLVQAFRRVAGDPGGAGVVLRRDGVARGHRTPDLGPTCADRDRPDRPNRGRAGRTEHLLLLPAADHHRRRRRCDVPAVARVRPAHGRPVGRRLLSDGRRALAATPDAQAVLAPDRDVGRRVPGEGGRDVLGPELALPGHVRPGQEHLDAGGEPAGRGHDRVRRRPGSTQGGVARRPRPVADRGAGGHGRPPRSVPDRHGSGTVQRCSTHASGC